MEKTNPIVQIVAILARLIDRIVHSKAQTKNLCKIMYAALPLVLAVLVAPKIAELWIR